MPPETLIRDTGSAPASLTDTPLLETWLEGNGGPSLELSPDADLASLKPHIGSLDTITIQFPAFTDGRGFSIARQLRRLGYDGDLIARGHLVPEQHLFAVETGFDAVAVPTDLFERQTAKAWADALTDFPYAYQRNSRRRPAVPDARMDDDEGRGGQPDPFERRVADARGHVREALRRFDGSLGMVSSFGADSAVLLHLVAQEAPDLPVYFLDTGKHFPETLAYRDELVERLGLTNLITLTPDEIAYDEQHIDDPDGCCELRKTIPLQAITHLEARITGRKRYQTPERADMPVFGEGDIQQTVNPLAFWTAKDVTRYIRTHDLPPHPLLAKGFLSIGCAPCTTPVVPGEDRRAGRWRNASKTECGIHLVNGKWERTETEKRYEVF